MKRFEELLDAGARFRVPGRAARNPRRMLVSRYPPRYAVELFDTAYYLGNIRQNPDIRFFVAYVVQKSARGKTEIFPRIFYKDVSLIWRSASHFVRSEDENWIGKGEPRTVLIDDVEITESMEQTTDLPFEIQTALDVLSRKIRRVPHDDVAISLVLRRGNDDRIEPYRDFIEPRRRARANPRNLINRGRSIARFRRRDDPKSLVITRGFEPDFSRGILEVTSGQSRMYGGALQRFRILSNNRKIQWLFFAGPNQAWIIPPQATTADLSSYGVRTIDVLTDEDLCIPGYEYHFIDEFLDPPALFSQIPEGFAGPASEADPSRADASAWLDRIPLIREFRRKVLGGRRKH